MSTQFPLPLSISTHAFQRLGLLSTDLETFFRFAKEAGFNGVELTETITTRWVGAKRIAAISKHYDLPIPSVHQSLTRMVFSTRGSVERLARRAAATGAKIVVVHVMSLRRPFTDHQFYAWVHEVEKRYGVAITFENAMAQFRKFKPAFAQFGHDPDDYAGGADVHNLQLTYDIGHMGSLNVDLITYFDRIQKHVRNIHLHDFRRGVDHLPLGTGDFPLAPFLRHLAETRYAGLTTLEVFPLNTSPFLSNSDIQQILRNSLKFFQAHTTLTQTTS